MARNLNTSWFWQDVRESLLDRPVQTALTFTAVGIGMLALTILLALLAGLQQRARDQIAEIGADVVMITPPPGGGLLLDQPALERLRALLPRADVVGQRAFRLGGILPSGDIIVLAASPELPVLRGWQLEQGRWLDPEDATAGRVHAVISRALADRQRLAIGDVLALRETLLVIVGIHHNEDAAQVLVVPGLPAWWMTESAAQFLYDAVYVKESGGDAEALAARIQRDFEADARPGDAAWTLTTPGTLVASTRRMIQAVGLVYGSVAVLCLLLGGVALSSLMLVSIRQRMGELGLRRALGASWSDIFLMFLCEGLVTTGAAGVIGLAAGLGLLQFVGDAWELPVRLTPGVILLPLLTAVVLGLFFSWYPARTAAALPPAEALRNE